MKMFLEILTDVFLYIPRRIYGHFMRIKEIEKENVSQEIQLNEMNLIFKRINNECDHYMKLNQSVSYEGFRKIKELAQTFPQEQI